MHSFLQQRLIMDPILISTFYIDFRRNPVCWVISMKSEKTLYLKINCLLALICVAFLCACYVSFVTHSCSWTIYAFEETCLTIGYMPSTSFSSAPSTKISTNRFIESCRWIAKIWVDKKLLSNSTILLSSCTWWYSFTTLRSTLIFRNKVWIEF